VFPNEALPGVTDWAPPGHQYSDYQASGANPDGHPYLRVNAAGIGVCDTDAGTATASYVDNLTRLDFLPPDYFYINPSNPTLSEERVQPVTDAAGRLRRAPYVVSFYARRRDASNSAPSADPYDNPIVLFRAQMPYREHNGWAVTDPNPPFPNTNPNVNLSAFGNSSAIASPSGTAITNGLPPRYPSPTDPVRCAGGAASTFTNRGSFWLYQFFNPADPTQQTDEPNLEPLCFDSPGVGAPYNYPSVPGSHTLMLPRGVSLLARQAYGVPTSAPSYTTDTSFHCADTDGDHKIDQVTITLALSAYDESGADRRGGQPNDQRIRLSHTISLPNVH